MCSLLMHSVDQYTSKRCQKARRRVLRLCLKDDEFVKEFVVMLVKDGSSCRSVAKCRVYMIWIGDVLKEIGGRSSLEKAVVKLVQVQEKMLSHVLLMHKMHCSSYRRVLWSTLMAQPQLVEIYLRVVENTGGWWI